MSNILNTILETKRSDVIARRKDIPLSEIENKARTQSPPRGFIRALQTPSGCPAMIAEIKKASPSRGVIRADFDPASIALSYADNGATCLSVLTDTPYFQGEEKHLTDARHAVDLPVLRKDFILDPYQVAETRAMGADCLLLILAGLDDTQAAELEDAAYTWNLDVLIETHDEWEIERALRLRSPLIGINNRNLKTLEVTLETTRNLAPLIPANRLTVCESGIKTPEQIRLMTELGADAFLIGETLLLENNPGMALRRLIEGQTDIKAKNQNEHTAT